MACSGDEFYTVEGEECSALEPVGELLVVWRDACGLVVLLLSSVSVTVTLSASCCTVGTPLLRRFMQSAIKQILFLSTAVFMYSDCILRFKFYD